MPARQSANALPVADAIRNTGRIMPNRLYVLAPGYTRGQCQTLATQSVVLIQSLTPKLSGRGAAGIKPYFGEGYFGVRWDRPYLWHLEAGTNPFTMKNLAGKAQPLDEFVLTPVGWQKMGAIEPGMEVIGSDGRPTQVLAVFHQGDLDAYRVRFSDGTSVRCSADHLWSVRRTSGGTGRYEVRTTQYLLERPKTRWAVPAVAPVHLEQLDLPLDPYLVGVFLGDGCLTGSSPTLSAGLPEVPEQVQALLPGMRVTKASGNNCSWTVTASNRGTRVNPLAEGLRRAGINGMRLGEKFIPAAYMAGSPESREALLQGLMDTDGTCSPDGYLMFRSCSPALAENVADLVRGLGGHASLSSESEGRDGGRPMHAVSLRLPSSICPFRADLPRKARYAGPGRWAMGKQIVDIEPDGVAEMQCLLVAAGDSLYVTSGYTLTHNTIPMWIDDPTGAEARRNPKAERRITVNGRRQIRIFRKAAKPGQRKRVAVRDGQGRLVRWRDVPASYPGAPGRIARRAYNDRMGTNSGKIAKLVPRPHVGVRWRHPGIVHREFMQHGLSQIAAVARVPDQTIYATYRRN